jgi:outer membrane protein assembly factor BamA
VNFNHKILLLTCLILLGTGSTFAQDLPSIKSISVTGTNRTKVDYIQKIIRVKPNSHLDSSLINEDIMRLKRLACVAHAYFSVDSAYNVTYGIEESFTLIPYLNIYTSTQNNLAARVGLYEYNLLGRNIQAGGFYQRDIFNSYGINIQAPHLFNRHFGLAINAQQLSTLEPIFLDGDSRSDYKYTNKAIEVAGLVEADFHNKFLLGISLFKEQYTYDNGATDATVPQNLDVNKTLYKFIHFYNNIDYYYQYLSGIKTEVNLQFVNANNATIDNFLIGRVDALYFKRIGKKFNFANRLRVGLSTNNSSPFAPFAVDNNINIRGVGNVIDRGTAAVVFNTELRHTWLDKKLITVQGNVFLDLGTWRNPGGELSDLTSEENFRVHPGIGIRLINKKIVNAVLRLDYGVGLFKYDRSQGFVIGIGQYF